jgi:hypothetical protein
MPDTDLMRVPATAAEVRREFGLTPNTILAAMFARLARAKDYLTLIDAATLLAPKYSDLRFLIVGDNQGPTCSEHYREVCDALAKTGVEDRFIFTGLRADATRLMLAVDVCLLSMHTEGLPLVLLEYMAAARPIVATAVGGCPRSSLTVLTGGCIHIGTPRRSLSTLIGYSAIAKRRATWPMLAVMKSVAASAQGRSRQIYAHCMHVCLSCPLTQTHDDHRFSNCRSD